MSKKSHSPRPADLDAEYSRYLKQIEAGNQAVTAKDEITHILTRMISLAESDQIDSPEYRRLQERLNLLQDFNKRQERIFNSLGF